MKNYFSGSAKYYNLSLGDFKKNTTFVSNILKKHKSKTVLELGCGSGLYLLRLKKLGYDIEGLDIGKEMLSICKKQDKTIKLYQKDMSKFNLKKKVRLNYLFKLISCITLQYERNRKDLNIM